MEDGQIVELYWRRDESALLHTREKYESYLMKIALSILGDVEDSRESVSDTYLKAWNAIPPHRPSVLRSFLAKLARETAIDLYRRKNREKRRATEYALALSELEECVSGTDTESDFETKLLAQAMERYLRTLPRRARQAFVLRYYFARADRDTARRLGMSESAVKSLNYRTRRGLKEFLEKEGFEL